MWVIGVVSIGIIIASFGISHLGHRNEGNTIAKDHAVGEVAAILAVLVWFVLMFLMSWGIINFSL